jgi:hypothetical protein
MSKKTWPPKRIMRSMKLCGCGLYRSPAIACTVATWRAHFMQALLGKRDDLVLADAGLQRIRASSLSAIHYRGSTTSTDLGSSATQASSRRPLISRTTQPESPEHRLAIAREERVTAHLVTQCTADSVLHRVTNLVKIKWQDCATLTGLKLAFPGPSGYSAGEIIVFLRVSASNLEIREIYRFGPER